MYTGQAYASGEIGMFNSAVRDQLEFGPYKLETIRPNSIRRGSLSKDSLKVTGRDNSVSTRTVPVVIDGVKQRNKLSFLESGLKLTDIALPRAVFTDAFQARMDKQRKQSADYQNSIMERKTIVEQTKLAEAKGEKDKTVERLKQEKAAVSKITSANTKLLQDSILFKQAKISEQIAIVEARTNKVEKDAEAYAVRKMNTAGIDPLARLKLELDAKVEIEEAKAKTKWPVYYMPGGKASDMLLLKSLK
jgi:hypothetical protein